MPIPAACPSCGATFRVPEQHAGKRGKCPRCAAIVPVPESPAGAAGLVRLEKPPEPEADPGVYELADGPGKKAKAVRVREGALPAVGVGAAGVGAAAAPTRKTLEPGRILAAFRGEIRPVRPTLLYRLWILIVAGVMVLLPLVYVALVALVAAALVYHAVFDVAIFQAVGHGRGAVRVALAIYVAPLVVGAVTVAFMLKPLFARPARRGKPRVLDPQAEPLLHAFVDGVCTTVNAPRPDKVVVDCQVNASAHREGGLLGMLGGELVLRGPNIMKSSTAAANRSWRNPM